MANRNRRQTMDEDNKLTKEEEKYAKYLRFNCPTKVGMLNSNEYNFFNGSKAVDTLMESKYGPNGKEPYFMTKGDIEVFIKGLIMKGAIFRAKKVVMVKKSADEKKKKDKGTPSSTPKPKRDKEQEKESKKQKQKEIKDVSDSETDANKDNDSDEKKEKKKKFYLVLQNNQSFTTDTSDVYAWVYDPVSLKNKIIGILICIGVVAGCLFPLWPDWLRVGIYYLSLFGIFLLLLLMGTALARTILFGIIYAVTLGKHRLWVLPNLTADCGFFESFQPWYTYEYVSGDSDKKKKKTKKPTEEEKEKLVNDETEGEEEEKPIEDEQQNEEQEDEEENNTEEHSSTGSSEQVIQQFETVPAEEFEPELTSRRRRRAARKDDNDFVMVDNN